MSLAQILAVQQVAVSGEWLEQNLNDHALTILHVGSMGSYEAGHVPGAQQANLRALISMEGAAG